MTDLLNIILRITLVAALTFSHNASSQAKPIILVMGDSLSAGYGIEINADWVHLLQTRLAQQAHPHQVVNASISGETTSGGLERLKALLDQHHPVFVIIELGGNDGLRGLSLEETKANLAAMIILGQQHGAQVLLLSVQLPPNYGKVYSTRFFEMYQSLASQYSLPKPPYLLEGVGDKLELMQADGIHPKQAVQPQLLENIWPTLRKNLDE